MTIAPVSDGKILGHRWEEARASMLFVMLQRRVQSDEAIESTLKCRLAVKHKGQVSLRHY